MKIEYDNYPDIGEQNWRIYVTLKSSDKITVITENFKWGFVSGEKWDEVWSGKNGDDTYKNYVSVITKDPKKLESYRPLIIDRFYEILEHNIKHYQERIKQIERNINVYENCLESDLFKARLREKKINQLL